MEKVTVALDWTPNVNHLGFFVAHELGYYEAAGILFDYLDPAADDYSVTPGKKLEKGLADFAIAPFETVISLNNKPEKVHAVATYTIYQEDLSCIVCLPSSEVFSPSALDGKRYASYKARYEDQIVKEMIRNDGGKGQLNILYPDKLGIWSTLISGGAEATWIFDNWEGVEAQAKGLELIKFKMGDYQIPYGYSPVVITKQEKIKENRGKYSRFLEATQRGFQFIQQNKSDSVAILKKYVTAYDAANIDLEKAVEVSAPYFGNDQFFGKMEETRVKSFLQWLVDRGLEQEVILSQRLFTNELL